MRGTGLTVNLSRLLGAYPWHKDLQAVRAFSHLVTVHGRQVRVRVRYRQEEGGGYDRYERVLGI